jgi:hypothetical protein
MGFLLRDTEPESAANGAATFLTSTVQHAAALGFARWIELVKCDGGPPS